MMGFSGGRRSGKSAQMRQEMFRLFNDYLDRRIAFEVSFLDEDGVLVRVLPDKSAEKLPSLPAADEDSGSRE